MRLTGKIALVTGASRGIGAAVVKSFAHEGARVAVNHLPDSRMKSLAESVADEINERGGEAIAIPADVSSSSDVAEMVSEIQRRWGTIDILVANAAAFGRSSWTRIGEEEWDSIMSVNLKGALLCSRAIYPGMRAKGSGKIITVSSIMVELGAPGALHYVTSKAGLIGFTRALAREVGSDGICVNSVMLGAIRTEQELEYFPDQEGLAKSLAGQQSLPRRGHPDDTVGAFLFLACHESDFVTGQILTVDGGRVHY